MRRIVRRTIHLAAASALIVGVAACGGSGDDDVATDDVPEETTTTAEPEALSLTSLDEGDWYAIRGVTEDDGYWESYGVDPESTDLIDSRQVYFDCEFDPCTAAFNVPGSTSDSTQPAELVPEADGSLSMEVVTPLPCLTPAGAYDGPEETLETRTYDLEVAPTSDGTEIAYLYGTMEVRETTEGSASCAASDVGYSADVAIFSPDRAPVLDPVDGVYLGDSTATPGAERRIGPCPASSAPCSSSVTKLVIEDGGAGASFEVVAPLGGDGNARTGTATYTSSCISDLDGSPMGADVYDVTYEATVTTYDLGEPITVIEEVESGTPRDGITPAQAEACGPYQAQNTFVGAPTTTPQLLSAP